MSEPMVVPELEIIASPNVVPPNYPYLEECSISVEMVSHCPDPILIDWVELRFNEEDGLSSPPIRKAGPSSVVPPNQRSPPIYIQFRVPLTFRSASNFFDVGVTFRDAAGSGGAAITKWFNSGRYIRVDTRPLRGKLIFISHSVPEDEERARAVKTFLERAGISGYIWEQDSRPGADYWPEKLYPKIDESQGLVAIWSTTTETRPDGVRKEVDRARKERAPPCKQYPVIEAGDGHSPGFPLFDGLFPASRIEHLKFNIGDIRPAAVNLVEAIDADIRSRTI
ncbi:MAG TPA: toll/interleukin-1 receptor domain-containing protein [Thermoplasmata archaeon]|nr:toll/interleukin-1 receptor domain-containing protein [Thermoplasmata archaeon]